MEETQEKKSNREWWYVGGLILLFVLMLVGGILLFSHETTPASQVAEPQAEVMPSAPDAQPVEDISALITGFHFTVEREDHENVLFAVNEHGKFHTGFSMTANGSPFIHLLDQNDYDGDGEMEAFVHEWGGGNAVEPPYIVYYDKAAKEFKQVFGFEPMEEVDFNIEHHEDRIYIVINEGATRSRYAFRNHELALVDTQTAVDTSDPIASFSVEQLFADATESDEKALDCDIDGDGVEETLSFYHDDSHALDYGRDMELTMIGKADGTLLQVQVTGNPILFLRTATNGMPDLLVSDKWLYKWDGKEYKRQE